MTEHFPKPRLVKLIAKIVFFFPKTFVKKVY